MNHFLKISKQTLWQLLGKALSSIATFIILGLVSRNYGPGGTGIFTLALTYLAMFYLLADFGFNAHVLRKLKVKPFDFLRQDSGQVAQGGTSKLKVEWRQLLGTRILWSLVLVSLALGLLPFLPFTIPGFTLSVIVGSLAIVASGVFVTCNLVFQSKLRYDLSSLASGIGILVGLPVFIFLAVYKQPVSFLLSAHLLSWLVIAASGLIFAKRFVKFVQPIFNLTYSFKLFKQSWPIAATLALNVLYFRVDSFMVAFFKSYSDAGIYNVAYSVFQTGLVLPTFIMNSYYPLMLKSVSGMRYMVVGLAGLSLFGTLATLITSPLLIRILTGSDFGGSVASLQILSLGFPAYFLSSLLMWFLIARGNYKKTFLLYTLGTLVNIFLNLIFIPKYSFYAASWTSVISEYFILLLQIVVLLSDQKGKKVNI